MGALLSLIRTPEDIGSPSGVQIDCVMKEPSVNSKVIRVLGHELYTACAQNDVSLVEALTSGAAWPTWIMVLMAAALENATDVATLCYAKNNKLGLTDQVLQEVVSLYGSDPAYRFLVESNFVDVNYQMDRFGTVLGVTASSRYRDRHSLVEYALSKGAYPNQAVECEAYKKPLTCAAGYSDVEMVKLLLDYGAELGGSGAVVLAAEEGRLENVQFLLAHGADCNERGVVVRSSDRPLEAYGTPLHKAVENGHLAVVDVLLEAGADLKLTDGEFRTAADIAEEKGMDEMVVAKLRPTSSKMSDGA